MNAGIVLAEWFTHEARRVNATLDENEADRDQRRLVEWIGRKGGGVTAREVQRGCRWLTEPGAAESALIKLIKAARGAWEESPTGQRGQPTRRFRLSTVYGHADSIAANRDSVDVDTAESADSLPPVAGGSPAQFRAATASTQDKPTDGKDLSFLNNASFAPKSPPRRRTGRAASKLFEDDAPAGPYAGGF